MTDEVEGNNHQHSTTPIPGSDNSYKRKIEDALRETRSQAEQLLEHRTTTNMGTVLKNAQAKETFRGTLFNAMSEMLQAVLEHSMYILILKQLHFAKLFR